MRKAFAVFTAFLVAVCLSISCFSVGRDSYARGASYPSVSAKSAVLYNPCDDTVYYEKNADQRLGMASTTKLMTALVAVELASPDTVVTVPKEAVGVEGSSVYLVEGERLTLSELLYALLLSSANDAAVAIAVFTAGSVESFAELMNARASELGLSDTNFVNPHGLYHSEHYTTARELAIIAAEVLKDQLLSEIVGTRRATISHDGEADKRLLVNHNKLLSSYDGALGMKTGYTKDTGRTLVSAAERDGLTLICVTLDAPDDWRDHRTILDYGFSSYRRVLLFPSGSEICDFPLTNGKDSYVTLVNTEPLYLTFEHGSTDYSTRVSATSRFLVAPVSSKDSFGSVSVSNGYSECTSPLEVKYAVESKTPVRQGFFERIINFFKTE